MCNARGMCKNNDPEICMLCSGEKVPPRRVVGEAFTAPKPPIYQPTMIKLKMFLGDEAFELLYHHFKEGERICEDGDPLQRVVQKMRVMFDSVR